MTIASVLIQAAMRENNLLPVGSSPTTEEATEGLALLNDLTQSLLGHDIGDNLQDWLIPGTQRTASVAARYPQAPYNGDLTSTTYPHPPANVRMQTKITAATTVYFPESPSDGARMAYAGLGSTATLTLNGNGKIIEASATKTILSAAQATPLLWFYRADLGTWKLVEDLISSAESLFPREFDSLLTAGLNLLLAPRHGKEPMLATQQRYARMLSKAQARYKQPAYIVGNASDMRATGQSYANNPFMV